MFLCRTGRLVLDQGFKSHGSFLVQIQANRQRTVTFTLHGDLTFQRYRSFCVSAGSVDSTPAHHGKPPPDPHLVQSWGHLGRVATIAANLSKSAQSTGANLGEPMGHGLFTGNRRVSGCSTTTMQTRASSTATATKKKEAGEGPETDSNKLDGQNLKEASVTSSSTEKAPGEPEPEGIKPNKTQQLKKVFREYGAVGVSFHIGISLMSLGMFYLLISSGIDMAAVLCKLGFSEAVVRSQMAAGTSTFVLAYAIHKLFAPVRISITLVSVPFIVRYFRKTGLFKPPTPAP